MPRLEDAAGGPVLELRAGELPSLQRGQQEFPAARPAAKLDVRISVSCSAVRVSSPSSLLIESRVSDCRI